jgi:TolA-binding protein
VTKTRIRFPVRAARAVSGAGLALLLLSAAALAQPLGTDIDRYLADADEGRLNLREVLDRANEIDIRLSKQIQLLQRQINQLQRQIEEMRADTGR